MLGAYQSSESNNQPISEPICQSTYLNPVCHANLLYLYRSTDPNLSGLMYLLRCASANLPLPLYLCRFTIPCHTDFASIGFPYHTDLTLPLHLVSVYDTMPNYCTSTDLQTQSTSVDVPYRYLSYRSTSYRPTSTSYRPITSYRFTSYRSTSTDPLVPICRPVYLLVVRPQCRHSVQRLRELRKNGRLADTLQPLKVSVDGAVVPLMAAKR